MGGRDKIRTYQEEIGDRIKEKRLAMNMTQDDFAKKALVSRELVVKWESGQRELKAWAVIQIANVLNTTCDYILRGYETQNLDLCERTSLSNRALENLLRVSDEAPDTLDNSSFLEDLINDLLESKSLKTIVMSYNDLIWAKDNLKRMISKGVSDEDRRVWQDQHSQFTLNLKAVTTPQGISLDSWDGLNDAVISSQTEKVNYCVYCLLETIKKAIEEG